jgi:hypothetical protein
MRTRRKEENRSDWRLAMEHIGRELRKLIRPLTCHRDCTLYSQGNVGGRE